MTARGPPSGSPPALSRPPPHWWRRWRRPRCATRARCCRTRWPTRSGSPAAKSPAASPLPGHLLATLGSGGHLAALVLLAAAGLATAASLLLAPPATPAAAARRIAIGLTALFLLSPATRFGYFIYPISLYAWAILADREWARKGRWPAVDLRLPDAPEDGGALAPDEAGARPLADGARRG